MRPSRHTAQKAHLPTFSTTCQSQMPLSKQLSQLSTGRVLPKAPIRRATASLSLRLLAFLMVSSWSDFSSAGLIARKDLWLPFMAAGTQSPAMSVLADSPLLALASPRGRSFPSLPLLTSVSPWLDTGAGLVPIVCSMWRATSAAIQS